VSFYNITKENIFKYKSLNIFFWGIRFSLIYPDPPIFGVFVIYTNSSELL